MFTLVGTTQEQTQQTELAHRGLWLCLERIERLILSPWLLLQVIINSTITPNMTFTKTSQKFGQWADSRANTVFGLGFSSELQLTKVCVPSCSRMGMVAALSAVLLWCRAAVAEGEPFLK